MWLGLSGWLGSLGGQCGWGCQGKSGWLGGLGSQCGRGSQCGWGHLGGQGVVKVVGRTDTLINKNKSIFETHQLLHILPV